MSKYERTDHQQPREAAVKKPYRKPAFTHERIFETLALQCGKVNSTQEQCHNVQKS